MNNYLTAPRTSKKMPKGIPYIIGNELAERFSFYGMKCILIIFMTKYLMDSSGALAPMNKEDATYWYHLFTSAVYFTPLIGAIIADAFFGKYKTILALSIVYCLGHLALAMDETRLGLTLGLTLISIGAGGIKPCVSAHVGDQFGKTNSHLLEKIFSWFYLSINLGAFISTILTPFLLVKYGPAVAFGVPGGLMLIATWVFWLGRNLFIHIPAGGMGFIRETFSLSGIKSISRLFIIYLFVAVFWALFDQTGSTWVLQAENLNRYWLGVHWLPSQIQAINPIMILVFAPLFAYFLYPKMGKYFEVTPLRKISIGLFLAVPSFIIIGMVQSWLDAGQTPSIAWQVVAYAILTAAEVLVSITCLEFSYTQAPNKMKSLIMGFFMLSVSIGNIFTAMVNAFIQNPDGSSKLEGASYFYFFAGTMMVTSMLFLLVLKYYKPKTYLHEETK
jgi:POT family proton-dependent oligopeptide transporter|tara:strand:- start:194 stop:1531 length:1338 start_codon:yes stop_codon:yes gene_type:complete